MSYHAFLLSVAFSDRNSIRSSSSASDVPPYCLVFLSAPYTQLWEASPSCCHPVCSAPARTLASFHTQPTLFQFFCWYLLNKSISFISHSHRIQQYHQVRQHYTLFYHTWPNQSGSLCTSFFSFVPLF